MAAVVSRQSPSKGHRPAQPRGGSRARRDRRGSRIARSGLGVGRLELPGTACFSHSISCPCSRGKRALSSHVFFPGRTWSGAGERRRTAALLRPVVGVLRHCPGPSQRRQQCQGRRCRRAGGACRAAWRLQGTWQRRVGGRRLGLPMAVAKPSPWRAASSCGGSGSRCSATDYTHTHAECWVEI